MRISGQNTLDIIVRKIFKLLIGGNLTCPSWSSDVSSGWLSHTSKHQKCGLSKPSFCRPSCTSGADMNRSQRSPDR